MWFSATHIFTRIWVMLSKPSWTCPYSEYVCSGPGWYINISASARQNAQLPSPLNTRSGEIWSSDRGTILFLLPAVSVIFWRRQWRKRSFKNSVLYFVHLNSHKLPLILQNNNKSFSRPFVGNECSNVCTVDCLHPDEYEYGLPIYLLPTLQPPTFPTTYFRLEPLQLWLSDSWIGSELCIILIRTREAELFWAFYNLKYRKSMAVEVGNNGRRNNL